MTLFELRRDAVMIVPSAANKENVLELAAKGLGKSYNLDKDHIFKALREREKQNSTAYGRNIAMPHARLEDGLQNSVALLMRLSQPIAFDAVDGEPVDLVFALVSPRKPAVGHLQALASLSRLSRDEKILANIRGASHSDAIYALVTERQERDAA